MSGSIATHALPKDPVTITQMPIKPKSPVATHNKRSASQLLNVKQPNTSESNPRPAKKVVLSPHLPKELGECIKNDVQLLRTVGWDQFIKSKKGLGEFSDFPFCHPARRLLLHYKHHGAPNKFKTRRWNEETIQKAIDRGAHRSCHNYLDFLEEEFVSMIKKKQWIILPHNEIAHFKDLRISPPGVIPQRERRPRWICDYSFYDVNQETLELFAEESMQYGHALDRILREILLADPKLGPVYVHKIDLSDGYYRISLSPHDIPRLGVIFPTRDPSNPLIALPLVLPMGWKNSAPIFCTATETVADLTNSTVQNSLPMASHPLATLASLQDEEPTAAPNAPPTSLFAPNALPQRDPALPPSHKPVAYTDVFVDDFVALAQTKPTRTYVRNTLMHAIDSVFRPLSPLDDPYRQEPISIKKLLKGDCSWHTKKIVLGWVVDTVSQTIHLPPHRVQRLHDILEAIQPTQKRIALSKWHSILGELRSMALALPGARNIFSHLQNALKNRKGGRIALRKGTHDTITDFKWMLQNIDSRPTRIAELIPLQPSALGHHDASGLGAGGVWFPAPSLNPRQDYTGDPILWRYKWPKSITSRIITECNPNGTITNSDLELAGGLLHLEAIAQTFDVRERTVLSKTDNLATLFWQRKGSTTTDRVPAYLLRLFGVHQRLHRYVPRHDYLPGPSNPIADACSRLTHLTNQQFFETISNQYKQAKFQLWHPSSQITSAVISALLRRPSKPESLRVEPPPPKHHGTSGRSIAWSWPSTPFSKPSKTRYRTYKSSPNEFGQEVLQLQNIPSALGQLRITYGRLPRRSSVWGPKTPERTVPTLSTSAYSA